MATQLGCGRGEMIKRWILEIGRGRILPVAIATPYLGHGRYSTVNITFVEPIENFDFYFW